MHACCACSHALWLRPSSPCVGRSFAEAPNVLPATGLRPFLRLGLRLRFPLCASVGFPLCLCLGFVLSQGEVQESPIRFEGVRTSKKQGGRMCTLRGRGPAARTPLPGGSAPGVSAGQGLAGRRRRLALCSRGRASVAKCGALRRTCGRSGRPSGGVGSDASPDRQGSRT